MTNEHFYIAQLCYFKPLIFDDVVGNLKQTWKKVYWLITSLSISQIKLSEMPIQQFFISSRSIQQSIHQSNDLRSFFLTVAPY